jgi:hypothetical protein
MFVITPIVCEECALDLKFLELHSDVGFFGGVVHVWDDDKLARDMIQDSITEENCKMDVVRQNLECKRVNYFPDLLVRLQAAILGRCAQALLPLFSETTPSVEIGVVTANQGFLDFLDYKDYPIIKMIDAKKDPWYVKPTVSKTKDERQKILSDNITNWKPKEKKPKTHERGKSTSMTTFLK